MLLTCEACLLEASFSVFFPALALIEIEAGLPLKTATSDFAIDWTWRGSRWEEGCSQLVLEGFPHAGPPEPLLADPAHPSHAGRPLEQIQSAQLLSLKLTLP